MIDAQAAHREREKRGEGKKERKKEGKDGWMRWMDEMMGGWMRWVDWLLRPLE